MEAISQQSLAGKVQHFRAFSDDEVSRILDACDPYWHCLTVIALNTGLRLESCRRLSPSHIKDGIITIMPAKTARFGRAVRIPVSRALNKHLSALHPLDNAPYCSLYKQTYHYPHTKTGSYYDGLLKHLGIIDTPAGKVGFHSLRDTFITRLKSLGIDNSVVRGIVGHTSDEMTDLYNHDLTGAIKAIDQLRG